MRDELETTDGASGVRIGDHYVLDDQIAEGGMGRVYRAHDVRLDDLTFAVKLLRGDIATTAEMRQRFLHEATTLRRLQHPNIVSVVDIGQTCGLLYMVMEYAPGTSLAELISHGPIPPARAVAITRQLGLGLEHMHDHGVIHRDFKPDNIVVATTEAGDVVRIVDFGLAITDDPRAARVTREGIAVGTPSYIAPEQARGLPLDGRADLFALGISLYEMLAGRLPFYGPPLEVVRLNATEDPPSIADAGCVEVPPALEAIVRRLMAREPEDRFASASEVVAALDALDVRAFATPAPVATVEIEAELPEDLDELEVLEQRVHVPLLPLYPTPFVPAPRRRRGPRLAFGVALLAAAAVLGVTFADNGIGEDPHAAAASPVEPLVAPVEPLVAPVEPLVAPVEPLVAPVEPLTSAAIAPAPPATTQAPATAKPRRVGASHRAATRRAPEPTAEIPSGDLMRDAVLPPAEIIDPFTDP